MTLRMVISTTATGWCKHVDDEPRPEGDPSNRSVSLVGDMDGAALQERTPCGVSVGFGGHGDVRPKERGEVTLVHAPDLGPDLDERQVGVGEQPFGVRDPAQVYVLVGRPPGRVLEQVCKMGGAHLRYRCERRQR